RAFAAREPQWWQARSHRSVISQTTYRGRTAWSGGRAASASGRRRLFAGSETSGSPFFVAMDLNGRPQSGSPGGGLTRPYLGFGCGCSGRSLVEFAWAVALPPAESPADEWGAAAVALFVPSPDELS